jgi:hypothetical protein
MRKQKDAIMKTILLGLAIVFIFPVLLFAGDDFIKDTFLKPTYQAAGAIPYIGSTVQSVGKSIYDAGGSFGSTVYKAGYNFGGGIQTQLNSIRTTVNNFQMPQISLTSWVPKIDLGQTLVNWKQSLGTWWKSTKPIVNTSTTSSFDIMGGQDLGRQTVQTNIKDLAPKSYTSQGASNLKINQTPIKNPARSF